VPSHRFARATIRVGLRQMAAAGEAGVDHALKILRSELERDMALLGCSHLGQIGSKHLARLRGEPASGQSL